MGERTLSSRFKVFRTDEIEPTPYVHRGVAPKQEQIVVTRMKKPTRVECKKLVSRLMGLPFPPATTEAVEVLIDALERSSESPEHAKAIVESFAMGECDRCPTGYDLAQRAFELRTIERMPDPACPKCFGSGHFSIEKDGLSYAGKSDCWRPVQKVSA
jgi:hypothetical protein